MKLGVSIICCLALETICVAHCLCEDLPISMNLSIERSLAMAGEHNLLHLTIENTGKKRFGMSSRNLGYEAAYEDGSKVILGKPGVVYCLLPDLITLEPGDTWKKVIDLCGYNVGGPSSKIGRCKIRAVIREMLTERNRSPRVLMTSNAVTLYIEKPNVVAEKAFERRYHSIGSTVESKDYFRTIIHRSINGDEPLYCTRIWKKGAATAMGWYRVSENVKKSAFDMAVSNTGDIHIWYRERDGKYYRFTRLDDIPVFSEENSRYIKCPLEVPEGMIPQFRLVDGKVGIDFVLPPKPDTDGEEPRITPTSPLSEGLRFTISLDRQTYKTDDKIMVEGKIENLAPCDRFAGGIGVGGTPRFRLTHNGVLIEDGTTNPSPLGIRQMGAVILHSGESQVLRWEVTNTVIAEKLKAPGKYTIQVSWSLAASYEVYWDAEKSLISNVVEFEILPPEGENGRNERADGEHDTEDNARDGERADSQSDDAGGAEETSLAWLLYLLIGLAAVALLALVIYLLAARRRK